MVSRRKFTKELKLSILRELDSKPASQICNEHEINPNLLNRWKREFQQDPRNAFSGKGKLWKESAKIAHYERLIGKLYAEIDLLKKTLDTLQQKRAEENKRWSP